MSYKTKEKLIDGKRVCVTPWGARTALKRKFKLLKLFGPGLAELAGGMKKDGMETDLSNLSTAIEKLLVQVEEDEFIKIIMMFFEQLFIDDREITDTEFDSFFSENLNLVYKIIGFVLEVNFGSFFGKGGIGKALNLVKKVQGPVSPEKQPVT